MPNSYYVLGDRIDKGAEIRKLTVSGADSEGNIILEDSESGETWKFDSDELSSLQDRTVLVPESEIDTSHPLWDVLNTLATEDDGSQQILKAARQTFIHLAQ